MNILTQNKTYYIETAIQFIKNNFPNRTLNYDKCKHDIELLLDAMIIDIDNNSTSRTDYISKKFYSRGVRQLKSTNAEIAVYNYLQGLINQNIECNLELIAKINELISIIKFNIENKPIYNVGSWNYITENRINSYKWKNDVPPKYLIDDILREMHEFMPSKQRRVRYKIAIIEANKHLDLQLQIYKGTWTSPGSLNGRYNPQVLAPYILAFDYRYETNVDIKSVDWWKQEASQEFGLASMFISLAAIDKGLSVGFCACIQNRKQIKDIIGIEPIFYLGIGYKEEGNTYFCPIQKKIVDIPDSNYDSKPSLKEYVKYV